MFDLDCFKSINDNFGTEPAIKSSSPSVEWRLRNCGIMICSAGSEALRIRGLAAGYSTGGRSFTGRAVRAAFEAASQCVKNLPIRATSALASHYRTVPQMILPLF